MAMIPQVAVPMAQIALQAYWNRTNIHLATSICNIPDVWKHAEGSCCYKVYLCFTKIIKSIANFFLTPLKHLCVRLIVPVSRCSDQGRGLLNRQWTERWTLAPLNPLMAAYTASELQVTAPDGTLIKGAFYRHQHAVGQDVPTIVCFGPNGALAKGESWNWLLKKGLHTPIPFNVVVFDYRSELSDADQCVLDGDAVIQALHGMGVSKHNLHMVGYSLGGGIGAQVRHLHADAGHYVNLRSFRSIGEVINHSNLVDMFIPRFIKNSSLGTAIKPFLAKFVSVLNWNIETQEPLRAIGENALVVYHPQDPVIPGAASPADWVAAAQAVEMRVKAGVQMGPFADHHNAELRAYEDANGLSISKRIMNFILNTDQFRRRQPLAQV